MNVYLSHLGKFNVPANDPLWAMTMTYTAEPPITVRHSMNPWETERQREVWLAEEKAWKDIVPKQAVYRRLHATNQTLFHQIQDLIRRIEEITGKKSGLGSAANYAVMSYSLVGGPYAWAAALVKFGVDMVLGIFKKKRVKKLLRKIEPLATQVQANIAAMSVIEREIASLIHFAEGIRASQPAKADAAIKVSEEAYMARRTLDRQRAGVLRERNRQASFLPRLPGGDHDRL